MLMISSLLLVSGCWDRMEPEEHAIVIAGGYDYDPETELYQMIFQMASPLGLAGGEFEGEGGDERFWTVSAWGHSIYDALANLRQKTSRNILFAHSLIYMVSERMAYHKGVLPVANTIARSRESRRVMVLAVVKGNDVKELLSTEIPLESANALGVMNLIDLTVENVGGTARENTNDFFKKFGQPGYQPYLGALKFKREEDEGAEEMADPGRSAPIMISGAYLFDNGKAVGYANDRQTRGINWVKGEINSANLFVPYPRDEEIEVDIRVLRADSEIKPVIKDGRPRIEVEVNARGIIVNTSGPTSFKEESEITRRIERRMAQVIENDINQGLEKAQSVKSDVFGFGFAFYRIKPKVWAELEEDWKSTFAQLPVDIDVKATVVRSGVVNRDAQPR
nr:Ger(x)C family spore germination protein [Natroniella sulfidigena]